MKKQMTNRWLFAITFFFLAISCSKDQVASPKAIASFQFAVDATNFLKVTFTNFSQNAASSSWDFGDATALSTDKDPIHTYSTAGTYTVKLSAKGAGGDISVKEQQVVITDPNVQLKKLTGETTKTWKLIRDVSKGTYPYQVGPADKSQIWYAFGLGNSLGDRPCALNDEYIFGLSKTFQYKTNGDIWADDAAWKASLGAPGCLSDAPGNFINVDGADISAWKSGNHTFEYDATAKTLKVIGLGAFIGLAKVATAAEVKVPQTSVTYKVIKLVDAAVDTLVLETTIPQPGYWRFTLVHYDNPLQEPALPLPPPPVGSINVVNFDFETAGVPVWATFGGTDFAGTGVSVSRIANPQSSGINTSGFVTKVDQTTGVQGWSGFSTDLAGKIDFTNKQVFKVKVYSTTIGSVVKLKLEEVGNSGNNKEIDATTTVANQWQELTFTFLAADANKWNRFVLFFDFQVNVKSNASSFLFDSVVLQ